MSDQASRLREIVKKKNSSLYKNINMITVLSGKGGVGKTILISKLYESIKNSFIIDCDINSPFFWLQKGKYDFCEGFDIFNNRKIVKSVEKLYKLNLYNSVLVDAGTGLNDINKYYIDKSKIKIFVSTMEQISILNTMSLMKNVSGIKILYMPKTTHEDIWDMQQRINMYSKKHLDNSYIMVCNKIEDIIKSIEENISR